MHCVALSKEDYKLGCGLNYINNNLWTGLALVLLMTIAAFFIKLNDFKNDKGVENIQATYHALLTLNSLSSLPLKETLLLPTVNLNGENNKNIPWAAAIPTKDGNYVYTSFPSLGFAAPYIAIRSAGEKIDLKSIFIFNNIINGISCLMLFFGLFFMLHKETEKKWMAILGATTGCTTLIFSCEALISSGLVYWPQLLSQLFISIIICLFIIRLYWKDAISIDILIALSLFSLNMTEWTGYVFCGLIAVYSCIRKFPKWKRLVLFFIFSIVASALVFLAQLYFTVDFNSFISTSISRFDARSAGNASFTNLLTGYWISFGLFLVFIIPAFFIARKGRVATILIISSLPLMENFILAQHATAFTFDRFKLAFPLSIIISSIFLTKNRPIASAAFFLVVLASAFGLHQYKNKIDVFSAWTDIDHNNQRLIQLAKGKTDIGCADIYADVRVRGYLINSFMRGIHEGIGKPPHELLKANENACSIVILHGDMPEPDLPRLNSIEIFNKEAGSPVVIN